MQPSKAAEGEPGDVLYSVVQITKEISHGQRTELFKRVGHKEMNVFKLVQKHHGAKITCVREYLYNWHTNSFVGKLGGCDQLQALQLR